MTPGAGILIGNHVSALDPVVAVMSDWWRVTAFTKVEVFERPGAVFFRLMGQIPLRRGDEASTAWAMDMASRTLAAGGKMGLYPEGTRSPDPTKLHRLHKRVLVPGPAGQSGRARLRASRRPTRSVLVGRTRVRCASRRGFLSMRAR